MPFSWSVRDVSQMLGLSPAQIRSFAARGLVDPDRGVRGELRFGFRDLILLRTANELTAARVPARRLKRVLERLREQLPEGRELTGVRITADGERVTVCDGSSVWNPESGQALFDFSVSDVATKAAPYMIETAREARQRSDGVSADDWYELACEVEPDSADEAVAAYRKAIEIDPSHADAHVNLGRLLHERGKAAAAETHYRAALAIDGEHPVAAFNLGVALEDQGRTREAIGAYLRAIELEPENADAHYNLAGLYERRGEKAAALRHLKSYRSLA
jgi:tetratricopeptide (TPR) repeat protein